MSKGLSLIFCFIIAFVGMYACMGWFGVVLLVVVYVVSFGGMWLIAKAIDNNQYYLILHKYDKTEEEKRSISFKFEKAEKEAKDLTTLKDEVEYIDICFKKKVVKTIYKSDFNFFVCSEEEDKETVSEPPSSNLFIADELKKLNELRKEGVISNKEFKDQKQRLLSYK